MSLLPVRTAFMSTLSLAAISALSASAANASPQGQMTAVLRLKEKAPIENLAQNVRSAQSMGIATHYEPSEIRELAGPADSDYDALLGRLRTEGFTVAGESPTHLWVTIAGDSSLFDRVFKTHIVSLTAGTHQNYGMTQVPSRLGLIAAINGLDTTNKRFPKYRALLTSRSTPTGASPAQIKTAYNFDPIYKAGITGQGQNIAIATYDGFNADDVNYFYKYAQLSPLPTVEAVNFNGTATYDEGSAMETQLDAEFSGMMAPGAAIHVFTSAANSDAGELALFTAILDDNRSKIVNYSWGSCETTLTPAHAQEMDKVFARAIAQGVNILSASGDTGSDSCQDGSTAADWPAAHPDIVAVGGTTLTLNGNAYGSEAGWNGSGGGISALWGLPNWQNGIGILGAQYTKRSYPDVAFNADPASGQSIYAHNDGAAGWIQIGGTSMAAPQWAGFVALIANARAMKHEAPMGFLNPALYAMSPADRAAAFHDVTSGSNGAYTAQPGWDAVTGLGSMQAAQLLSVLSR